MSTPKRHIALIVCLLYALCTYAQGGTEAHLSVQPVAGGFQLDFVLGHVGVQPAGGSFVALQADGLAAAGGPEGHPALPTVSRLLLLPRGTQLSLLRADTSHLHPLPLPAGAQLLPYARTVGKDLVAPPPVAAPHIYRSASPYGTAPVSLVDLGQMGPYQVWRITVSPFTYHPATGTVDCLGSLSAQLGIGGSQQPIEAIDEEGRLLVVAPESYREGLSDFLRWKRQEGYLVRELYINSNRRDSIQPLVRQILDPWQQGPLPYLLLVGDVEQMQAYIGRYKPADFDGHVTDLYYADLTGDYLPDALCGRLPAADTAQLRLMLQKTLRYEQCLDLDTAQLRRVLLVAGRENSQPAPVTTNGQVAYLGRELLLGNSTLDTLCFYNPTSDSLRQPILDHISHGVAMVNYTAHCSAAGWSHPKVSFSSLDTLANLQPVFWVNNCCTSNNYAGTCFGEQLLRRATGGAVAVIGATNSTLWNEDYYWAVGPKYPFSLTPAYDSTRLGAFDRLMGRRPDLATASEMLVAGNLAVSAFGSPYDNFYWEIYCLLGDPTLRPLLGVPQPLPLALADTARTGATTLSLLTLPGARVSAVQADSLLGTAVANAVGVATLPLASCLDTLPLLLTATAPGHAPATTSLQPAAPTAPLAFFDVRFTDSTLLCTLANLTSNALHGVVVEVMADSLSSPVATVPLLLDSLTPQARLPLELPCRLAALDSARTLRAHLTATVDTLAVSLAVRHRYALPLPVPLLTLDADRTLTLRAVGGADSLTLVATLLPSGQQLVATAADTMLALPLPATADPQLLVQATLHKDAYSTTATVCYVLGSRYDSFEDSLHSYPWHTGGTQPWQLDNSQSHSGQYSLRSGSIGYRQTSDLLLHIDMPRADSVSFWARVSSEQGADIFTFSVDGTRRGNAFSGQRGWTRFAYLVPAGNHLLRWRYSKDESGDVGDDCAWLDDVRLPHARWDSLYGWFGPVADVAIDTAAAPTPWHLSPNPTSGLLTLHGPQPESLRLLDAAGRTLVGPLSPAAMPLQLDLRGLPAGTYFVEVRTTTHTHLLKVLLQP